MKERLTGAIIVVAALVLLVPELLTGPESKHAAPPAAADSAQLRSYTIDLQDDANRQPPASAPAVAAATDDPVGQAATEPDVGSPPVADVAAPVDDAARATGRPMGSGADSLAAAPNASSTAAPSASNVASSSPSTAAKPDAVTPPSAADDKPRSAFGPSADAARAAAARADAARAEAAKAEAAKVEAAKAAAVKADAAKSDAAKAEAARAAAAKAEAAKAQAAKAEAARVAAAKADSAKPAAKPESASSKSDARSAAAGSPTPKGAASKGWAVQLGVFGSRDNAERLAKQVKGSGYPVLVNESSGKDGKKLYWVRVGPEAEQSAANALSAKLKAAGHHDARVVAYP